MYTLKEILEMPYDSDRRFISKNNGVIYYIDIDGILRFEATKEEMGCYGENLVCINREIFDWKFDIMKNYIPFQEAFDQWYFNNKTIYCEKENDSTKCFEGSCKDYVFYPKEISTGKWYLDTDNL